MLDDNIKEKIPKKYYEETTKNKIECLELYI